MTSSYTTNKAIEKPGYNDYVNSWNTPINNDWDIIDKCFGGSFGVSTTGGATNLTQAQVQAVYITVSGTLGSNATINFPSGVSGFYIVYNGTTGAYTVTLASSGGGTSVTVTQLTRAFVFSDGTNIYYADDTRLTSYVSSISFGSTGLTPSSTTTGAITVAGTLGIANGGTGATTFTQALTNLGGLPLAGGTLTGALSGTSASFSGTLGVTGAATLSSTLSVTTSVTTPLIVTTTANVLNVQAASGQTSSSVRLLNGSGTALGFFYGDGTNLSFLNASGTTTMYVTNSGGNLVATGNVTAYSDARLKKDVMMITNALDKVKKLRGVEYTRIDTGEPGTGLIAQEVQRVLPQAVQDGEYLSVAYGNLVGLLVEAIKDVSDEVDRLKMRGI
jgi:hypothetical protein